MMGQLIIIILGLITLAGWLTVISVFLMKLNLRFGISSVVHGALLIYCDIGMNDN